MKKILILVTLGCIIVIAIALIIRAQSRPKLESTLPIVAAPSPPTNGEYDASTHEDESALPEEWVTKHPIYSFIPQTENGFTALPTDTFQTIRVILQPAAPQNSKEREAELRRLQQEATRWLEDQIKKFDPNQPAADLAWIKQHPAGSFDYRRGLTDLTIQWTQAN